MSANTEIEIFRRYCNFYKQLNKTLNLCYSRVTIPKYGTNLDII